MNKSAKTKIGIVLVSLVLLFSFILLTSAGGSDTQKDVSNITSTIKYTPSTETSCIDGKCNLIIYSGTRFVEEDNQWKK